MRHESFAMKTARIVVLVGATGCAAAGAFRFFDVPARLPHASDARAAADITSGASFTRVAPMRFAAQTTSLPASLEGSTPPRLPLDVHGRLAKTHAVREFFDYFLSAQHEVTREALEAMVRRQIATQLDGTEAERDALDIWQRYVTYRQALERLAPLVVPASAEKGPQADAIEASLDTRASLATRTMGAEWSEAFFGADWRRDRRALRRLRVTMDSTLTDAQKRARLEALDDMLPLDTRATLERQRRTRETVDTIAALQAQNVPLDALRARATEALGAQTAERIVTMRKEDDAWRAKYADYAAQRAGIEAMGMPSAEREAQIAQLRARVFANSGEVLRATSLDRGP
jgi:lipase chaperone LimK